MLMFRATDIIQHKLWHRPDDIATLYEFMDTALAEIVAAAGDGTSIWLMSDHGFGPQTHLFYVNQWLRDQGWLAIRRKTGDTTDETTLARRGQSKQAVAARRRFANLGLSRDLLRTMLPRSLQSLLKRLLPRRLRQWLPGSRYELDPARTVVFGDSRFTTETQALRINLQGREKEGVVEPGEYEDLRSAVIQALRTLRDPETGEAVVEEVYKGEELFAGPYVQDAPDLILRLREGYKMNLTFGAQEYVARLPQVGGCHRQDGIFMAMGPDISAGGELSELSIADVMPTLLHWMGMAVPAGCDGQVRQDVFVEGSEPAGRAVAYQEPTVPESSGVAIEEDEDDEAVLSRLRDLGYIS